VSSYTEYLLKERLVQTLCAIAYLSTHSSLINCVCKNQNMRWICQSACYHITDVSLICCLETRLAGALLLA